ncbi:hypothetical protein A2852_01230 [Candidatus Adlerbacteria bacterium RIFCSPHIGHO2_01_FULL_54_23]|uniref:Uncharacterized protein n=3 Tax=Candidatus Adleribacteriota TaxID=1752736 RepID=A0A1F4Y014_9BACT|nr:MAG: hypothetical protein UY83_C0006G0073 [Candidatus Adlerbacteria bacterium GW2011_GWA1_54_10]KKW37735.1 MAG: hypothetical protein UY86_C0004G0064 [Candidatus Adlerbacteria bacterium GW2011_GWB1_54_7]OGC79275.1 MAG: hypothetical protein A2852_01230 [Candidatus Adlerbacteria bacterium RIFCSPHIGHO2_01_FULL_54_23]OGC87292.1 MAG: hypothetical protein A3B33_00780 [Candidatus Adlerbacteria bacterium RIFCSPLOWO2_01_FULL_54_16]
MRSQSKVEENRNLKHPRPFRPADGKLPASKGAPHPEMQSSTFNDPAPADSLRNGAGPADLGRQPPEMKIPGARPPTF